MREAHVCVCIAYWFLPEVPKETPNISPTEGSRKAEAFGQGGDLFERCASPALLFPLGVSGYGYYLFEGHVRNILLAVCVSLIRLLDLHELSPEESFETLFRTFPSVHIQGQPVRNVVLHFHTFPSPGCSTEFYQSTMIHFPDISPHLTP